jgi:hypothetical protein
MWRRVEIVLTDVSEERAPAPAHAGSSLADFLLFFFYPEIGGDTFLRNVG